jgi:hypothetical protein
MDVRKMTRAIAAVASAVAAVALVSAVALAAVPHGVVTGTVRDGSGVSAIPGITVTLYDASSAQVGSPTTTDASGRYTFPSVAVANGPFRLKFYDANHMDRWAQRIYRTGAYDLSAGTTFTATANETATVDATMAAAATVVGAAHRLGHADGPIAGVNVSLAWLSENVHKVLGAGSDSNGEFGWVGLAPGDWALSATDTSNLYGKASVSGSTLRLAEGATQTVDVALPLIPVTNSDVHAGWYTASDLLTFSVADGDLPPFVTTVAVDGVPSVYSAPFLPSGEGTTALLWSSSDASGNVETTHSAQIRIDRTPPSTVSNADGEAHRTLVLSATDTLSGVAGIRYRVDGSAPATYTGPVLVRGGLHAVQYWAVDVAGNVEATHAGLIDNHSGSVQGTVRAAKIGAGLGSPLAGVNVELYTPPATPGGVPGLVRTLGPTGPTGSFSATGVVAGDYLVKYTHATAGYSPQWWSGVWLQANAQTITVVAGGMPRTLNATMTQSCTVAGDVHRSSTTLGLGGLPVTLVLSEGGRTQTWSVDTDSDGRYSFIGLPAGDYVLTVDGASAGCISKRIPAEPDTMLHLASGYHEPLSIGLDAIGPVTLQVTVGRMGTETQLEGAEVTAYELSGTGIVATGVTDADGRAIFTGMVPGTWRVAATAPGFGPGFAPSSDIASGAVVPTLGSWSTQVALPLLPTTTLNLDGRWYAGSAHATLTVAPGDLPVASTRYALGGSAGVYDAGAGIDIVTEGITRLDFASVDASGSAEDTHTAYIRVDSTPPTSTATASAGGPRAALSLAAADALSGVASTRYRLDGGSEAVYSAPIVTTKPGLHAIEYWSVDKAGNAEAHRVANVINTRAVAFGTLSAAKSVKRGHKLSVSGTIWPRQARGNTSTRLLAYRLVGSKYVLVKAYKTVSKPSGSKSRFAVTIKLTTKGKWKLVAHSPGYAGYWQADSAAKYVTVK